MATFTQDEVNTFQQQTNDDINAAFFAKWKSGDILSPLNVNDTKSSAYLQVKYQEKC
jgi:hypothetical protein